MKRLAGQAGRTVGYLLHHTGMIIITVFFVASLSVGALAYRLSLGPVQIPWITSRLADAVSGRGVEISIGQAALAWSGYKSGAGVPLYLQLGEIVVRNAAGVELVEIPSARLVFLPAALIGTAAPILVTSSDALFAGSAMKVSLAAAIRLGFLHLSDADLNFTLGPGRLGAGEMSLPISAGSFTAEITPDRVQLRDGHLALARINGAAPNVGFAGQWQLHGDWQGALTVTADAVQAAALPAYWPPGLVAPTRDWVTNNIQIGEATRANFTFGLSAPASLTSLTLGNASGQFDGQGLSVGWVPHAAPITGVDGVFTLSDRDTINISANAGTLGAIALKAAHLTITGVSHKLQMAHLVVPVSGDVAGAIAVLNAPPLSLLKLAPPPLLKATGTLTGQVTADFPLRNDLQISQVALQVSAHVADGAAPLPLAGLALVQGIYDIQATASGLRAQGSAALDGEPAAFAVTASFDRKIPMINATLRSTAGPALLRRFGVPASDAMGVAGAVPMTVQIDQMADGGTSLAMHADLTPAALALQLLGWSKQAGEAGDADVSAVIGPDGAVRVTALTFQAPRLAIAAKAGQGDSGSLQFSRLQIGGSDAAGEITPPAAAGQPWRIALAGPALDVSGLLDHAKAAASADAAPPAKPQAAAPPSGPLWQAQLRFDRLVLSEDPSPALHGLTFDGDGQGGRLFNADAAAADPDGARVTLAVRRAGETARETVEARTPDGGLLLRASGFYQDLEGGDAVLQAGYSAGGPVNGVLTMTKFRLLHAPVVGKIMQGLTLYGVADATSGPGLAFQRLVAPFSLETNALRLTGARAFSSSLGFTASGTIGLQDGRADLDTTIVPAYFLNAALGNIPGIGKLFSAEKGGGLFALRAKITGKLSDPRVSVNPLSALTPGALRDVFGVGGTKP